jgi:hypothetical protein
MKLPISRARGGLVALHRHHPTRGSTSHSECLHGCVQSMRGASCGDRPEAGSIPQSRIPAASPTD